MGCVTQHWELVKLKNLTDTGANFPLLANICTHGIFIVLNIENITPTLYLCHANYQISNDDINVDNFIILWWICLYVVDAWILLSWHINLILGLQTIFSRQIRYCGCVIHRRESATLKKWTDFGKREIASRFMTSQYLSTPFIVVER